MAKTSKPTLTSIAKILEAFVARFNSIDHQLIQLQGETTYTRTELSSLRAEMGARIGSVEAGINDLKQETSSIKSVMNRRFDEVDDKLQNLFNEVDIVTTQKLEKFRQQYFPA